jgi:Fe-S-cluster containining protein
MIIKLKKSYPCIHGLPVIHSVDTEIFEFTYFMHCMQCTFCNDQCCEYGADIDLLNVDRIMKYSDELEKFTGIKQEDWFDRGLQRWDHEYPGGDFARTAYVIAKDSCVFLNRKNRGCMLHSFALNKGIDYHELKPFFCTLFPVTYFEGVLCTPEEIDEKSLACMGSGPTLYEGARNEIKYYFGDEIIDELDKIESEVIKEKKLA